MSTQPNTAPIASPAEAEQVKAYLVKETAQKHGVSEEEAAARIEGLFKSGILEGGNPANPATQLAIDGFLSLPSSTYAHLK